MKTGKITERANKGANAGRKEPAADKERPDSLRQRAETLLRGQARRDRILTVANKSELIHELNVHQTELEMQNEELRRTQVLLEESRDKYFSLYDFAPVGYVTLDGKGLVRESNLAGAALLGVDRAGLLGAGFSGFVSKADRSVFYGLLERVAKTGQRQAAELEMVPPKRPPIFVHLEAAAFAGGKKADKLVQVAITDISERRLADQQKNDFIAIMSHELRNPLTPILAGVQLIRSQFKNKPSGNATVNEAAKIIEQQTKNMVHLLDDLLDISRISLGKIVLKKQTVNLVDTARQAARNVQLIIKAQRHELTLQLPDTPLYLEADPVRLEQIMINLLNNAAKYSRPGGQISLEVRRTGQDAQIVVRDSGIGIEEAKLDAIFELFMRGASPFASTHGEMGIGLKLSRDLVRLHGGSIIAKSDGPERGSKFSVLLPALPQNHRIVFVESETAPKVFEKMRILIVDDNLSIVKLFVKIVQHLGHEVRMAGDGISALAMAKVFKPEIVMVDIGLPGMSGYDVARELRQWEKDSGKKIKLIAVTGYGQDDDKKRATAAGFDLHLTKPVDMDTIEKVLTRT